MTLPIPIPSRRRAHRGPGDPRAGALAGLAVVCSLLAAPASAAPEKSAREVVAQALADVIAILNDTSSTTASRRERIADIAYAHFDFDTMSRLVVARPWRKFSDQQRTEFIHSFKTMLARSYGRRLSRYEGTQVEVVGEVQEPRGDVTVHSKVVGGQFDGAEMNYRMREKKGSWLVIDVIIEGVSLVSNFRSQFKPILASGGPEELLRRMNDKNDVLQAEIVLEESDGEASTRTVSDTGTAN